MPYSPLSDPTHGGWPEASWFNQLSDNLDAVYNLLNPGYRVATPQLDIDNQSQFIGTAQVVHVFRYLHYMTVSGNTGTLKDPSGVHGDITLPDTEGEFDSYDLDDVSWLAPGVVYEISGVRYAQEDAKE